METRGFPIVKRSLVLLTVVVLSTISLSYNLANAAVKAGSPCIKLKSTITVNGNRFICLKKGQKMVWSKVVKATAPTPPPSPSPTIPNVSFIDAIKSPSVNGRFPINSLTFPIPVVIPTTWDDVYRNQLGISYQAWLAISKEIANSKSSLGKVNLTIGSNTKLPYPSLEGAMSLVSKAFSNVSQPNLITIIAFDYKDKLWADDLYRKLIASEPEAFRFAYQNAVIDMCNTRREVCWSAMGLTDKKGDGIILLGTVEKDKLNSLDSSYSAFARSEEGLTIAHEYFHTIQRKIMDKNFYRQQFGAPTWFNESTAVFVENGSLNHNSYQQYMRFRAADSRLAYPSCGSASQGCIEISEEIMKDFLSLKQSSTNWSNFPYGMQYEVSNRVIEILVALKGLHSITDIYTHLSQDHTFEEAFQQVYGISYAKAIPIMAKIVSEEFSNNR
jgi:hypothetical protein